MDETQSDTVADANSTTVVPLADTLVPLPVEFSAEPIVIESPEVVSVESVTPEPIPTPAPEPVQAKEEPRVVEKIVEREVVKEVIKEVVKEVIVEKIVEKPVEKIVEKIVYRDRVPEPAPLVCPPPTEEEIETIHRDFLINLSHEGTAKKHELMLEKKEAILMLFDTREHIVREDVMDILECSSTTATRLLTVLRHEGKLILHGTSPHTFTYTKY